MFNEKEAKRSLDAFMDHIRTVHNTLNPPVCVCVV